jgi:hypothetical protein
MFVYQVPENEFYLLKNKTPINADMEKRLLSFLEKYDCFSGNTTPSYPIATKGSRYNPKTFYPKKAPTVHSRTKITNNMTSFERHVGGMLNKLTRHNYIKLSQKILSLNNGGRADPSIADINTLMGIILEKCWTQACFVDLFVSLISDLYKSSDESSKEVIVTSINCFISNFVENEDFFFKQFANSSDKDYINMCDKMAHKTHMYGKHKTILLLLKHVLHTSRINSYLTAIIHLYDSADRVFASDTYELLLDFLNEFTNYNNEVAVFVRDYLKKETPQNMTNRARYKLMDIINH